MRQTSPRPKNRADEVRQRRQQRSQKNANRVSKRATYSATAPTIIVRGGMGVPIASRTTQRPRRKMFIPLGSPGAEMHMPAVPAIRPGWRILSTLIVLASAAMIFILLNLPFFQVSAPQINGIQRITAADLEAVLGANGMPIALFDPAAAKTELAVAFPELSGIDIQVSLPADIIVNVGERQPVIEWRYGDQVRWIDNEGILFPPRGDGGVLLSVQSNTLPPVIQPAVPGDQGKKDGKQDGNLAKESLQTVPQQIDPGFLNTIIKLSTMMPQGTILAYSPDQGLGWVDPEGWQVFIGAWLEGLDTKITIYHAIVNYLNQEGIRPAMISVSQANAPYYRMEQ